MGITFHIRKVMPSSVANSCTSDITKEMFSIIDNIKVCMVPRADLWKVGLLFVQSGFYPVGGGEAPAFPKKIL